LYTRQQVERGKKIVTRLRGQQFALGDLMLEVFPYNQAVNFDEESKRFCEEIGVAWSQAKECRRVSRAFPPEARENTHGNAFSIYKIFANHPQRHILIKRQKWTVSEAKRLIGAKENVPFNDWMKDLKATRRKIERLSERATELNPSETDIQRYLREMALFEVAVRVIVTLRFRHSA
jgi:hypothetical protein